MQVDMGVVYAELSSTAKTGKIINSNDELLKSYAKFCFNLASCSRFTGNYCQYRTRYCD
ncbi:hypothetical protein OSCI_3280042 [Kamptonema sp. PCC 6506]|nr:hypothetical protein OSCI_3280042 [Kamptonema sp. PCC 6506]